MLDRPVSIFQNRENFVFFFRASAPKFRETFAKFLRTSHTHSHLLGRLRPHGTIASSAQCGGSWQHPPPRAPILRSAALVRQDGAMAVLPIGRWIQELKLRFPLLLRRSNDILLLLLPSRRPLLLLALRAPKISEEKIAKDRNSPHTGL